MAGQRMAVRCLQLALTAQAGEDSLWLMGQTDRLIRW